MPPNLPLIRRPLAFFDTLNDSDLLDGIREIRVLGELAERIQNRFFLAHVPKLPQTSNVGNCRFVKRVMANS